jgi:hypothetical protein
MSAATLIPPMRLITVTHQGEHGPVECDCASVCADQPEAFVNGAAALVLRLAKARCTSKGHRVQIESRPSEVSRG